MGVDSSEETEADIRGSQPLIHTEISILVVEDHPILLMDTGASLQAMGLATVMLAATLAEARRLSGLLPPDVALLDVNLSGGETTVQLGLELSDAGTRVIFSSGYLRENIDPAIQDLEFLEKPISPNALQDMLERGSHDLPWKAQGKESTASRHA